MNGILCVSDKLEALLRTRDVTDYEFRISETEKRELNTERDDFSLYRTIFGSGVSVSVVLEGKKGAAAGSDLSDEGLEKVIGDALVAAESSLPDDANGIAEAQPPEVFHSGPWDGDMAKLYDSLTALFRVIGEKYPHVNPLQIIADHERTHTLYRNSNGVCFEQFDGIYHVAIEMSGSDGELNTGLDYVQVATHDLDTALIDQGGIRSHLEAVEQSLHRVALPGKFEGTMILTPDCLGNFLYMLASNYIMSSVIMDGTSQWLDRLGEQVASEKLTVLLKAHDERIAEREIITDDGYRAEDVTLIEKGVLKSFLLNRYAAKKTGRDVTKNTGFAMVMEPGDTPLADMIASVKRGLIVGGFSGGEPGANGEFSGVAKNSFLVEDGIIVGAVTETMINGNLEHVFRAVAAISTEQICDGTSVLPYLACEGIVISGK